MFSFPHWQKYAREDQRGSDERAGQGRELPHAQRNYASQMEDDDNEHRGGNPRYRLDNWTP